MALALVMNYTYVYAPVAVMANDTSDSSSTTSIHIDVEQHAEASSSEDGNDEGDHEDNDVHKVQICHIPQGNPENMQTIEVDESSVTYTAHIGHGDSVGPCQSVPPPVSGPHVTISASKIICDKESDLPNWGTGGPAITASTASAFLATHSDCHAAPNWSFQWGDQHVSDPGDTFVGIASATSGWSTFGVTTASGSISVSVPLATGTSEIRVREVQQTGYIPFTYNTSFGNSNNVSAEMYCANDVLNYDNFDFIRSPIAGNTYYCVAFNVLKVGTPPHQNTAPVITVVGANPFTLYIGSIFSDPGATAYDLEDGTITPTATGTVNGNTLGTYTVTYNATDSQGLPATSKTRTVNVVPLVTQCNDGIDNDGDGLIDFPADTGCDNPNDNSENNKPVITVTLPNPMTVTLGTTFTDSGATAFDLEDGTITSSIVASGTVNTNVIGSYVITYNVQDSGGLVALAKTRTVVVATQCSDGKDNEGDGLIDMADPGCDTPTDNNENSKPAITVLPLDPMYVTINTSFVDPGAIAYDQEDGTITPSIVATGTVDTSVIGTYTISYNVQDSQGLAADTKTRTVNVVPLVTQCNDGIDNDGDGLIDFPNDPGCDNPSDNNENNKPIITVLPLNPMDITVDTTFTDPGATAFDLEDGTITPSATGTVDTANVGIYTITYNATDSQELAADTKTRTVNVISSCSDGKDNDADGLIDFPNDPGCSDPNDNNENAKPILTLLGDGTVNIVQANQFVDPFVTAYDQEDGTITPSVVASGTVDINNAGTYVITYNVTDSGGLAADTVTRTINVIPVGCTSNCGGGGSSNQQPVITVHGDNPMSVIQGTVFTDPFATAADPEDGNITNKIVATGTVDTGTVGTYVITYNATDSQNYYATPQTRTVNVVPAPTTGCVANCGGGGGGPAPLNVFNEHIAAAGSSATITWNTNIPADSRVIYGTSSVSVLESAPFYGYTLSSATDSAATTTHAIVINDLDPVQTMHFRPVSSNGQQTALGIELHKSIDQLPESCQYIRTYMRMGIPNDQDDVIRLQAFLKTFEGFIDLPVTGVFDLSTDASVRIFQERYRSDVLDPWGLTGPTGYVYYTTQKKVNEIYCKKAFPLDGTQLAEIDQFNALLRSLQSQGGGLPTSPLVGINRTEGEIAGTSTTDTNSRLASMDVNNLQPSSTSKIVKKPENRGRLALLDLLATIPPPDQTLATGATSTTVTRSALAAVFNSINKHSRLTVASMFTIFSLLLTLFIISLLWYQRYLSRMKVKEMVFSPDELNEQIEGNE